MILMFLLFGFYYLVIWDIECEVSFLRVIVIKLVEKSGIEFEIWGFVFKFSCYCDWI